MESAAIIGLETNHNAMRQKSGLQKIAAGKMAKELWGGCSIAPAARSAVWLADSTPCESARTSHTQETHELLRQLTIRFASLSFFLAAASVCALPARAQFQDENLILQLPQGYVSGFEENTADGLMSEFVPEGQSVENWTDMITVQVFYRRADMTPAGFEEQMRGNWLGACPDAVYQPIRDGEENGYAFSFWLLNCPKNPGTGSAENTFFKAIRGNDAFYVVQKAFKSQPQDLQIVEWTRFLSEVYVCDSRLEGQACPDSN